MYSPDFARDPRIVQMPGMVERLAESDDIEVLVALAENPALPEFPPGALALLLFSPAMDVVLRRDDLPWEHPQLAPYAILRGDLTNHEQAARRPDLHRYPEAAWVLASHPRDSVREALAANPVIVQIEGLVEAIAQRETDKQALRGLAKNPALPSFPIAALERLVQNTDVFLLEIARRNDLPWDQPPFAPYAILRGGLADHKQAAQRPDLHEYPQAAWYLARHPDDSVREALAANPAIGQIKELVDEIATRESDASMQRSFARNPALARRPDIARKLANSDEEMRWWLAENPALPALPEDVIHALLQDTDVFLNGLAQRDDLPWDQPPFAPYAILRGDFVDHIRAAQRPDLHEYPQAAWYLAKHPDGNVREVLAANPVIEQIEGLFEQIRRSISDGDVQHGLARNPVLAQYPDIARKLANSDKETRWWLAENPSLPVLPEDVIRPLLQDTDVFLNKIARRDDLPWEQPPFAPYAILRGDFVDHWRAAQRPDLYKYPQAAWHLANHPNSNVREALAANPAIEQVEGLVEEIVKREFDASVRRGLARNPVLARYPDVARKLTAQNGERRQLAKNPALSALLEDVVQSLLRDTDIFLDTLAQRDDLPWDRPPFAPYAILRGGLADHRQAAQRPDLHKYPEAAWHLVRHPEGDIREALAANPSIGQIEGFLEEIAKRESDGNIRRGLARNPALARHPEIARNLAESSEGTLRRLAENPALSALPEDVVQSLLQDRAVFLDALAKRDDLPWDQPPFAPYAAMRPRPAQPTQPAAQQQGSDGWIEIKIINGRRYRYLRWREGGKKRSRYLGKEKE